MSIVINHCFGIGYRCNTDDFMNYLNIRKYSGPFSYMICDLDTSIYFIQNKFMNFTDVIPVKTHNFKWNNHYWGHHLYFNTKYVPDNNDISINTLKNMCVWNHHNLEDIEIIDAIKRRSQRLLDAIYSNNNTLLIYIDNIKEYTTCNWKEYINTNLILEFISKLNNCYILILLPLLNFNDEPVLYNVHTYINVIFYNSNMEGNINDVGNINIQWDIIKKITLSAYIFDIF